MYWLVCQITTNLNILGKRESRLRNCLYQIGLKRCILGIGDVPSPSIYLLLTRSNCLLMICYVWTLMSTFQTNAEKKMGRRRERSGREKKKGEDVKGPVSSFNFLL